MGSSCVIISEQNVFHLQDEENYPYFPETLWEINVIIKVKLAHKVGRCGPPDCIYQLTLRDLLSHTQAPVTNTRNILSSLHVFLLDLPSL